jgi:hypothetical protein
MMYQMSGFFYCGRTKFQFSSEEILWMILTWYVLWWGLVSNSIKPQPVGQILICFPRVHIPYIRCCPPYWRPFLHPQPEDAPCCFDKVPLITLLILYTNEVTHCKRIVCLLQIMQETLSFFMFLLQVRDKKVEIKETQ